MLLLDDCGRAVWLSDLGARKRGKPGRSLRRTPVLARVFSVAMDAGLPISYEVLAEGTPVYSSDGAQIGKVAHVLAVEDQDILDGLVISQLFQGHFLGGTEHRFVDAPAIDDIHEHAVRLKLDSEACKDLPEPSANPAVMSDDPADNTSEIGSKLRRAWDRISGNY